MSTKKLLLSDIPYWRNLLIFDNICFGMVKNKLWFELSDDSSIESVTDEIYTYSEEEYQWCMDFALNYEWVENCKEAIERAFKEEVRYGDVHSLFKEINDYVDRFSEIKRKASEYI